MWRVASVKERDENSLPDTDSEECTHGVSIRFLAATAALEVQMLVCLCVCHTCYNCTGLLQDFCWTSAGLKDFQRTSKRLYTL